MNIDKLNDLHKKSRREFNKAINEAWPEIAKELEKLKEYRKIASSITKSWGIEATPK